jgi:hypothetical protein
MGALATLGLKPDFISAENFRDADGAANAGKVVGMYIHQHWPYHHPYAARTWTLEDYRGYADGLKKLGFNTLVIWPMVETMPNPLTSSDRANLEKIGSVIDMLHREYAMRAFMVLSPNIIADNVEAAKYTFQQRHFFYCDRFVEPGDTAAVKEMIAWRERLLRPLSKMDGIAIIDSDPGGYPGSTNEQFVNLLGEHRKMLDRLRRGIELYYWMHVGWKGYCRYYETGKFEWGTVEDTRDILTELKKLNPAPWGITIHTITEPPNGTDLKMAETFGLGSTALAFNYGAIEGEPSFPMTNFGGDQAFQAGRGAAPGGVVGNAQTHCVQLPNTFAFARGANGESLPAETDYVSFANDLIEGGGQLIVGGWRALAGQDSNGMIAAAKDMEKLSRGRLTPGRLKGLLFGDPRRFINDLVMELRLRAAYQDFVAALQGDKDVGKSLRTFVSAADSWQRQHGYQCYWNWPGLKETLRMLKSSPVDAVLDENLQAGTPFEQIAEHHREMETFTVRLIEALKKSEGKTFRA